MKIVCISDTHNEHERLGRLSGDVLVVAGDFTKDGSMKDARSFRKWLKKQEFSEKLVIPGNHDQMFHNKVNGEEFFDEANYISDKEKSVNGVKFYGFPWCPKIIPGMNSNYFISDKEIRRKSRQIPEDTDFLITHSPPKGYLDRTFLLHPKIKFLRAGSRSLYQRVREIQPSHHVFGHVHNSNGTLKHRETHFHNVSIHKYRSENNSEAVIRI